MKAAIAPTKMALSKRLKTVFLKYSKVKSLVDFLLIYPH